MPTVTLSSKHQVTLPADLVRSLGLKPGDKLVAELISDHIVLLPQPESWANYFVGSMKGFWGSKEEIDQYIAEERRSWERGEWLEEVDDLIAIDEGVCQVVKALSAMPEHTASFHELSGKVPHANERAQGLDGQLTNKVAAAIQKLVAHGAIREINMPPDSAVTKKYRLKRAFIRSPKGVASP